MTSPGLVRWLWRNYFRQHAWLLALSFVLMLIEGAMLGAASWMIRPLFDEVFNAGDAGAARWVALLIFGVFALRALASFTQRILMSHIGLTAARAIQSDLVAHLLTLDLAFFRFHPPGSMIERVRGDTAGAVAVWPAVFGTAIRDGIALVSLLTVAFLNDPKWTMLALVGAPLFALPVVFVQAYIRRHIRRLRETSARLATRLDEIFHGLSAIKLNGIAARERARFDRELAVAAKNQFRADAGGASLPAMIDLIAALGFMLVLLVGAQEIIAGTKTTGQFMSFFTAMTLTFEPLRRLGTVGAAWATASACYQRLQDILAARSTLTAPETPAVLPDHAPEIRFENVSFTYGEAPVLRDVSFTAEPGQTTALVGASGAGKTTILHLVSRLADPTAGAILLNGADLRAFDPGALRLFMSVVGQDNALFDDSLRDNILLGGDAGPDALDRALTDAHVAEFLPRLAGGLDFPVGARGMSLSGGQRQRVQIARAFLRNRPVLLLDEATSALDAASEAHIQASLDGLTKGRTVLVVAHRLSTIRNADKIVVLAHGRVVEQGRHADLLAKGGTYAALFASQSGGAS